MVLLFPAGIWGNGITSGNPAAIKARTIDLVRAMPERFQSALPISN